jgi:hypothetical protein
MEGLGLWAMRPTLHLGDCPSDCLPIGSNRGAGECLFDRATPL